jgi:DNA-binding MarR family transcriptional regulator
VKIKMDDPRASTANNYGTKLETGKSQIENAECEHRIAELIREGYDPDQAKRFAFIEFAIKKEERQKEQELTDRDGGTPTHGRKYTIQRARTLCSRQRKSATDFYIGSDINLAGLSANAFRVLACIKSQAGGYGRSYCCSIRDLRRICKLGQVAVENAIKELAQRKFISYRKKDRKTTRFTVLGPEHWCTWITERQQ